MLKNPIHGFGQRSPTWELVETSKSTCAAKSHDKLYRPSQELFRTVANAHIYCQEKKSNLQVLVNHSINLHQSPFNPSNCSTIPLKSIDPVI
ncbi:hypothetical protein WICANDRAFT_99687 [Wickerhamomyces anomalus NRRL Y-366-8]|uniref:Uncharacterized protein n=1 Tax=Wickerhamomyces anomalus (strain ATCC 58044 / CBS 1984 / NCYC 433 / NRRL Y-366-8) TaxID=683960 RepID=A0A1E3P6Y2_WICAA|nr:uncharacterized protein WICANDRAFT_99687 [Wickerhamomyces anomalus NRRL Y-366-8]ODQ61108.1 hypothetical protein WICANDRAFT_99687 [Wickerhamomyces anomalus NRRL Y-366-8]